jgi:hypothetical protein
MPQIELVPTLDLCIEGTARQEFLRITGDCLQRGKADRALEERIDLLRMFLETADFRRLRAESERHQVEGKKVRFFLYLEDGRPRYELKVDG